MLPFKIFSTLSQESNRLRTTQSELSIYHCHSLIQYENWLVSFLCYGKQFITSFMDGSLCKHAYRKLMVYERIFPSSQKFYASMKRRTHAFNNFKTILKDKKSQRFSAKCYITSLLYGGMHAKLATWGTIY